MIKRLFQIQPSLITKLILIVLMSPMVSAADGPIGIDNQYPLAQGLLTLAPTTAEISKLPQIEALFTTSNTALVAEHFTIDAEVTELKLQGRLPIQNFEAGLALSLESRTSGKLDRLIDSWHEFFHFPDGDRPGLVNNSYDLSGEERDQSEFSLGEESLSPQNLEFSLKYPLLEDTARAVSFEGRVSFPSLGVIGQKGVSILSSILHSSRTEPWKYHAGVAHIWSSDLERSGLNYVANRFEGFALGEYMLTDSLSLTAGPYLHSKLLSELSEHSGFAVYFDLGLSVKTTRNYTIELLVRENPYPRYGTADVSFLIGVRSELCSRT